MVKLPSSQIALDSMYLYSLPWRAIYHDVLRIARGFLTLSTKKKKNPKYEGKYHLSVNCHFDRCMQC